MHFWVALWSFMSPHTVDVQTHASCPQCMWEHFEVEFHLKDKASLPTQHVTFPMFSPISVWIEFHDGVTLSRTSSLFQLSLTSVAILGSLSHSKMDGVKPITAFVFFPFVGVTVNTLQTFPLAHQAAFYLDFQETKRYNSRKECLCLSAFVSFQQTDSLFEGLVAK